MSKSLEMEALEIFEDSIISTKHKNAYEILEKAVKRNEPMKVYYQDYESDGQCPNCDYFMNYNEHNYCPNCGQKLDWGNYDDE